MGRWQLRRWCYDPVTGGDGDWLLLAVAPQVL